MKTKFTKAIVKRPSKSLANGLTTATLGKPDYKNALLQHSAYIAALQECGLQVTILDADEDFPDSCFVEDVALLTPHCAILTNPGVPSRKGEVELIKKTIEENYSKVETINPSGSLEAGDVMMVGSHFYIGLSERTNEEGANQLIRILEKYGMTGSTVILNDVLHLKTGLAYLENNNLIACGEFVSKTDFQQYRILEIPNEESYAANCIWVNDFVILPKGYPRSKKIIRDAGYRVIEVDVSEFRKLDGGLSCLSLRL